MIKNRVRAMLEQSLTDVYMKFKIHFYQEVFNHIHSRETSLSTVETFCVEIIHALNEPTVNEFASFIKVSSPNAAYKVNSLIKKGYVEKIQSPEDRREYHLRVTDKFFKYFNMSQKYVGEVTDRMEDSFSPEEVEKLDDLLNRISNSLMPEVTIPSIDIAQAKEKSK